MFKIDEIKNVIGNTDYNFYGIRIDECAYSVGAEANYSHEIYQDPQYDIDDQLLFPYIEEGIYAGFYDAGELPGTCVIKFDPDSEESIVEAINEVNKYYGDYVHILAGDSAECGTDDGEIIIKDAIVIMAGEI